jgi:hypothetical protein
MSQLRDIRMNGGQWLNIWKAKHCIQCEDITTVTVVTVRNGGVTVTQTNVFINPLATYFRPDRAPSRGF